MAKIKINAHLYNNFMMDSSKITPEFAQACIKKLKYYLNLANNKKSRSRGYKSSAKVSLYDLAKQNETKTRNLKEALILYVEAAINGEKVNSCIKDCASVLHQGGLTHQAVKFLQDLRAYYKGDAKKYDKLIQNLESQLKPTGKHEYTNILIDLVDIYLSDPRDEIPQMFGNFTRVKQFRFFKRLGFTSESLNGRYVVLEFDSFSAAKKTIQTFKQDQWFGTNKFWLDTQYNIVAQCKDIKTDFETGFLFNRGRVQKFDGEKLTQRQEFYLKFIRNHFPNFQELFGYKGLELKNQTSKYLIQNVVKAQNQ